MLKFFLSLSIIIFSNAAFAKNYTVKQLVNEAISKNHEIAAYEAAIKATKANHLVSGRLQNPELEFGIGRNKVSSPAGNSDGLAYTASITQPIDWPGRLSLRQAIAKRDVELAELGLEHFKFNLASKVRILAQKIVVGQYISKMSKQNAARYGKLKDAMDQRKLAGIAPQIELSTIEAATLSAQLKVTESDINVQADIMELKRITGMNIDKNISVTGTSFKLGKLPLDKELFRMAAENNYDIHIKRSELEQQGFKVNLAKNERYPTFSTGPFISQENADEDQTVVGMNFSIPLPVWNNGSAKVSSAKAQQVQAEANLNLQQRNIEKQLMQAALIFRSNQSRLNAADTSSISSSAAEAENYYQLGSLPIATYITMQDKYLEAVTAVSKAKIYGLEAALMIEELTGAPGSIVKLRGK